MTADILTKALRRKPSWRQILLFCLAMPLLALWLLLRCVRSMLRESYEPELWARLEFSDGAEAPIRHW